jgi:polar amino acid transport system substrate-binding protein
MSTGMPRTIIAKLGLLLFGGAILSPTQADDSSAALKIAASSSIAPYVLADDDRGMVVDILRKALAMSGYVVTMEYAPNVRAKREFETQRVDGIYNLTCGEDPKIFYSQPIVYYQNVVVTLESAKFQIHSLSDLAGLQLIAFQNAPEFLGEEFARIARANPRYEEVPNQAFQVDRLFGSRADAIVLDQRIFLYFLRHPHKGSPPRANYVIHPLFAPAPRCAAFTDKRVRDAFDQGLESLQKSGEYRAISAAYGVNP